MNALPHSASVQRAGLRPVWLASAALAIASIAGATVAVANVPAGGWSSAMSPSQGVTPPPVIGGATLRQKARCQTCGVVETIRQFDAVGAAPAGYEFTVRLRDGSIRVSSDASPASWRVGDSIMLVGVPNPPLPRTPVSL